MDPVDPTSDVGTHSTSGMPPNKFHKSHTGLIVAVVIIIILVLVGVAAAIIAVVLNHRHKITVPNGSVTLTYKKPNGKATSITNNYSSSTYSGDMKNLVTDLTKLLSIQTDTDKTDASDTKSGVVLITPSYNSDPGTVTLTLNNSYEYVYVSGSIMPYFGFDTSFIMFAAGAIDGDSNLSLTTLVGCPIGELPVAKTPSNNSS